MYDPEAVGVGPYQLSKTRGRQKPALIKSRQRGQLRTNYPPMGFTVDLLNALKSTAPVARFYCARCNRDQDPT